MKKILLTVALCFIAFILVSQTDEKRWNFGISGGLIQYSGDLGGGFYKTDQAAYGYGGISVSRYLSRYFDATLLLTKGESGFTNRQRLDQTPNSFLVRNNAATALIRFYFTESGSFARPFLLAGGGLVWYEPGTSFRTDQFVFSAPSFGGGINIRITRVVSLQFQEIFMAIAADHIDGLVRKRDNDMQLYHSACVTFNFGKHRDADRDGVADKNDRCPGTATGISVNATGCPSDSDSDGIADNLDECPQAAGSSALKGCPDSDQDGITDKSDRCPHVSGSSALKGCPDADRDGIADPEDKCPGTKDGYKVDRTGCVFDNDKDGVVNEEDLCPELAGILAFKGCPDTDGDGVSDNDDGCPESKGVIANKGCPEIPAVDIQRITLIAGKIYFEAGSAKLKLISNASLDDLAEILKRNDAVNLTIEGHTDSDGNDIDNLRLSQERTESVKAYLISRGIEESRLTAKGYGEGMPVAGNSTAAGKARNRRVELKTSF